MKQVINAISALAIECEVNRTNMLFPEDDNVSVNSKPDHPPFFACFSKIIARGWGFKTIFLPQVSEFRTFLCPGGGEFALSKTLPGGFRGDGQAWNSLIHNSVV